jgi:hypothetical protein
MLSKPNGAALLLKEREGYVKRAKKLREVRKTYDPAQERQEKAHLNDCRDKASADEDLLYDHVLFVFPKKIIPFDHYDSDENTRRSISLSDVTFFTKKKSLPQNNGRNFDLTTTYYVLTLNVGIKGTKKRLLEPTNMNVDDFANEIAGMALSP